MTMAKVAATVCTCTGAKLWFPTGAVSPFASPV